MTSSNRIVARVQHKPRELRESTFHEALYEWTERAPWLALSLALHLFLFFVLMALPWDRLRERRTSEIRSRLEATANELFDFDADPLAELEEEEPVEEPVLREDLEEEPEEEQFASVEHAPFDAELFNDAAGFGGEPGGELGERFAPRRAPRGGGAPQQAVALGLEWLRAHQHPDGSWRGHDFPDRCGTVGAGTCSGAGDADHDVGLTGLALLAFLGEGSTTAGGRHQDVVQRAVRWLLERADSRSGRLGRRLDHAFLYDHAIATLALCESYYFVRSPRVKRVAQAAVDYIQRARNPGSAWRYQAPPDGDNDTSVTGWMIFALSGARAAGLEVDDAAFAGAIGFLNDMTDPETGRVGYVSRGGRSGRGWWNRSYPADEVETLTAVGLLCRIFIADSRGWDISRDPILAKHADLLSRALPKWDASHASCDMYYWYHGSYAMYQMGGDHWKRWRSAMERAVVRSQSRRGDEKGSWDPVGPWGRVGGRIYSTALMTLCLEVYYRYGRVLGAR